MRSFLIIAFVLFIGLTISDAQRTKSTLYSAASNWTKVTLKSTPRIAASSAGSRTTSAISTPASPKSDGFRPAFTADFATNRNGWLAGKRGDYEYQIGQGRYGIRKQNVNTKQVAFATVELPDNIELNRAETFTIKADILADSGRVPMGGLIFGMKDSLNYNAFTLNENGQVSIKRVANGETFSDYMPGEPFKPGVPVDKNRNRLSIRRLGPYLYFYINEREIKSSPYPFKILSGNGVGVTSSGYWTGFQKLIVTVGI